MCLPTAFDFGRRQLTRGAGLEAAAPLAAARDNVAMKTLSTSGLAPVNGIELAWQEFGEGGPAPLILLHGGFGSVEMFGPNVAALDTARRVIGVDLRSHGRSPAADRPMRFETMADDIAALTAAVSGFLDE